MKYAWIVDGKQISFNAHADISQDKVKKGWQVLFPNRPCPNIRAWVLLDRDFEKLHSYLDKSEIYKEIDWKGKIEYGRNLSKSERVGFSFPLSLESLLYGVFIRKLPVKVMDIVLLHELGHIAEK